MLEGLSQFTLVTKILVTGGLSQQVQLTGFRRQPDIVVATPGRILDMLLNASNIHIELLEIVVLDEADRLLEMGFKQEVSF
jgi:ATP-dependent RNA helicase DDX27